MLKLFGIKTKAEKEQERQRQYQREQAQKIAQWQLDPAVVPHEEMTLSGHSSYVNCLTVLPDGRLASGSGDNTIKLWDMGLLREERVSLGGGIFGHEHRGESDIQTVAKVLT